MSGRARMWGGEGTRTLTGGQRPMNVPQPEPGIIHPLFASDDWWHECRHDSLDAPDFIARGGVVGFPSPGGTVMFASERRP